MAGSDEGRLPGEARLTKEEWDELEPLLAEADRLAQMLWYSSVIWAARHMPPVTEDTGSI